MTQTLPLLWGAALLCFGAIALTPLPVAAQTQGYNTDISTWQAPPISRAQFQRLQQLGGAIDEQGYYEHPFPADRFYGQPVYDGLHEHPMAWQPRHSILIQVENGDIVRQDLQLNPLGGQQR